VVELSLADVAQSLAGGALIGASASALLRLNGRIAGISGIVAGMFEARARAPEAGWKRLFVAGLLTGGAILAVVHPAAIAVDVRPSLATTVIAGLLVGVGTKLAGGCTSGHGVCGLSRLSPRSFVATLVFVTAGFFTVFVTRHLVGVAGVTHGGGP
jgi:uncharacterized membrane protein YedE/YeeE